MIPTLFLHIFRTSQEVCLNLKWFRGPTTFLGMCSPKCPPPQDNRVKALFDAYWFRHSGSQTQVLHKQDSEKKLSYKLFLVQPHIISLHMFPQTLPIKNSFIPWCFIFVLLTCSLLFPHNKSDHHLMKYSIEIITWICSTKNSSRSDLPTSLSICSISNNIKYFPLRVIFKNINRISLVSLCSQISSQ